MAQKGSAGSTSKVGEVNTVAGAGQEEASLLVRTPCEHWHLRTSNFALGCLPSTCSCSFARLEVHTNVDRHMPHCAVTHAVSSAADTVDGAARSPLSVLQGHGCWKCGVACWARTMMDCAALFFLRLLSPPLAFLSFSALRSRAVADFCKCQGAAGQRQCAFAVQGQQPVQLASTEQQVSLESTPVHCRPPSQLTAAAIKPQVASLELASYSIFSTSSEQTSSVNKRSPQPVNEYCRCLKRLPRLRFLKLEHCRPN